MQEPPLVSIIIPTYNSAGTLEYTLESIFQQTYFKKEIIVVDGNSSDSTIDIVKKHSHKLAHWISEKDQGIADALNKGIRLASGEWLYFLGSDDSFSDSEVLASIFECHIDKSISVIYGDVWLEHRKRRYDGEFNESKLIRKDICHQAQFYRRDVFQRLGLYNTRYKFASDWFFNLRAFVHPEIRWKYIDRIVANFNDTGRTSYNLDVSFIKDKRKLLEGFYLNQCSRKEIYDACYLEFYYELSQKRYIKAFVLAFLYFYHTSSIRRLKTYAAIILKPEKNPLVHIMEPKKGE